MPIAMGKMRCGYCERKLPNISQPSDRKTTARSMVNFSVHNRKSNLHPAARFSSSSEFAAHVKFLLSGNNSLQKRCLRRFSFSNCIQTINHHKLLSHPKLPHDDWLSFLIDAYSAKSVLFESDVKFLTLIP